MTEQFTVESFGTFLIEKKLISQTDLDKAERARKETATSLLTALKRSSLIPPRALAQAVSEFHGIPLVEDDAWQRLSPVDVSISSAFLRENQVFPIGETDGGILLAMEDPSNQYAINAIRLALGRSIVPRVAAPEDIQSAIERSLRERDTPNVWTDSSGTEASTEDVDGLRDMALGAPVVRFVNQLLQDAVHSRATDIHIEPFEGRVAVRLRVDGMLRELPPSPANMGRAIASRIKILSGLNIAERRIPQDGRARIRVNQHRLDLRIATMPTVHGEAVAIRLLDNVRRSLSFPKLGFTKQDEAVILKHLAAPYGLMLVTGPTGSGKTTTLATALAILNEGHRKILTVEDPIEYEIDGVNQTQVKPSIGLTFANALRSFLRHDPDVMMVGEMRDGETAGIGIHAALTGHLVLSTLHTNTAAGAIPRLLDMGIDAYLLASSLRCVIGQRLVRVLCPHCKRQEAAEPDFALFRRMGRDPSGAETELRWQSVGCDRCYGTGYADRIVISEVLDVDDEIRELIRPDASPAEIEAAASRKGMTTMIMDGYAKCEQGLTTPEEVRRVALDA
jgi:general secretion pathway protein E